MITTERIVILRLTAQEASELERTIEDAVADPLDPLLLKLQDARRNADLRARAESPAAERAAA